MTKKDLWNACIEFCSISFIALVTLTLATTLIVAQQHVPLKWLDWWWGFTVVVLIVSLCGGFILKIKFINKEPVRHLFRSIFKPAGRVIQIEEPKP